MTDFIFSAPWWLALLMGVAGVVLFLFGHQRIDRTLRGVGLVVVALGVILALLSYLVETDLERATRQSRELIEAVERRDWPAAAALLHPQTSVQVQNHPHHTYAGRDRILEGAELAMEQFQVGSVRIRSIEADQTNNLITVHVDLLTEQALTFGRPLPSSWRLEWQRSGDDWVLLHITAVRIERPGRQP